MPVEILLEPTPGYEETVLHCVTPCILPVLPKLLFRVHRRRVSGFGSMGEGFGFRGKEFGG